ncbi:hypothetical protein CISIN_1g032846mg [Citrus sinensis]|uniref:Uncharacterized protein n=1 Tax=Citrus sinensis TaxID=2711 RepID=A0A067GVM4_CITSI|nr:hypothetical protein CISIN_1g032846mg [Citrus sinensis]
MLRTRAHFDSCFEASAKVKPKPTVESITTIPAVLTSKSFLLPTLSSKKVEKVMNKVLVSPTPIVASNNFSLLLIPAFLKILGPYNTMASIPVACSKKCIPIAATKILRTAGVGRKKSSFHTPLPRLCLEGLR